MKRNFFTYPNNLLHCPKNCYLMWIQMCNRHLAHKELKEMFGLHRYCCIV